MKQATIGPDQWKHEGGCINDTEYNDYLQRIKARFAGHAGQPLFNTSAAPTMFGDYLLGFPAHERGYHKCRACEHFISRYGSLAVIADNGRLQSPLWDEEEAPPRYALAVRALREAVERAEVVSPIASNEVWWGKHKDGIWTHYHVRNPAVHTELARTPGQRMAEWVEDFGMVSRALAKYPMDVAQKAVKILKSDALFRSEKVLGVGEWFLALHKATAGAQHSRRKALIWKAVATAPAGFAHVNTTMIATLLEGIAEGRSVEGLTAEFKANMDPTKYQRPQAAPKAGNIVSAEKLVEKLGIAQSMYRRFARVDEMQSLWRPTPAKPATPQYTGVGVFSKVKPRQPAPAPTPQKLGTPPRTMSWKVFERDILPEASSISYYTGLARSYIAFATARYPDAPPILQWDFDHRRNPVSWYLYTGGSSPEEFGLRELRWVPVTAVVRNPAYWYGHTPPNYADSVSFLLKDSYDARRARGDKQGNALFPETLKSELHGVRATIEAFSKTADLGERTNMASGIQFISTKDKWECRLKVVDNDGFETEYNLDRWE